LGRPAGPTNKQELQIMSLDRIRHRGAAAVLALLLAAVSLAGTAHAQAAAQPEASKDPLSVTLTLQRVTKGPQGQESLAPADHVRPGELLEYRAVYTNRGDRRLDGVVATLPVPDGMEYQAGTASPSKALAATGDGKFGPEPLVRKARKPDGTDAVEPVPYGDYRALRWQVGALEPKQSTTVSARVRVSASAEPAKKPGEGS
jgi:uncharacterized repeat protein (TIGR01451 family)